MLDNNDLLNSIKKAAQEAVDASKPVAVLFGKVLSVSPLEINVEQKMILHSAQLVLTRSVTDYTTDVTVDWSTENENVTIQNDVTNTMAVAQKNINLTHAHGISGKKSMTIHHGLKVNDEVILLRMQGGQKYVVIDKVG